MAGEAQEDKVWTREQMWYVKNILSLLEEQRSEINELRKEVASWGIREREKGQLK